MEENFKRCVEFVLAREAGYVDNPKDPGGATNLGITIATLHAWRGHKVTSHDVQKLGRPEAIRIYHKKYWLPAWGDALPAGIDLLAFDAAVNMGIVPAINLLREQVGIAAIKRGRDHVFHNPEPHVAIFAKRALLQRVESQCMPALIMGSCERRRGFYRSLSGFATFGNGWLNRVRAAQDLALRLWSAGPVLRP